MKALIVVVALALAAAAQDTEFAAWMKTTNTAAKVLKAMDVKTGAEATGNAERLGLVYENMIGFWRRHNAKDAVKWSEAGKAAAAQLASAARAGDTEKAGASFQALTGTCQSCHEARRERVAEDKFRIRYVLPKPAPPVEKR